MSALTHARIKVIAACVILSIIIGVWTGFPRWSIIMLSGWVTTFIFGIPLAAFCDKWDRLKAEDALRNVVER